MIKLSDLTVVSEDGNELWAFCPFHDDKNRPNLLISKTGKFAGFYKCFGCGAFGEIEGDFKIGKPKDKPISINWQGLSDMYKQQISVQQQWKLKQRWCVRWKTLERLEIGWDGQAWTFPVRDAGLNIVGIQRVFLDNSKRMVNSSKIGVIVPFGIDWQSTLYITEGISDTVVAADLNLNAIGRLSCTCGNKVLIELLTDTDVVIISDNDEPGKKGAKKLRKDLQKHCKYGIIVIPEVGNDLREWRSIWGNQKLKQFLNGII